MNFDRKSFLFFIKTAVLIGFFGVFFVFSYNFFDFNKDRDYGTKIKIIDEKINFLKLSREEKNKNNILPAEDSYFRKMRNFNDFSALIANQKKAVGIDLDSMKLITYENGSPVKEYTVVSKGKPGSSWETPTGVYKVNFKNEKHFSSIGKVFMPYSIQFYGNFFIHGWPYYPDGAPVHKGYSGGCVRLETGDAKEVFDFTEKDTPIFVYDGNGNNFVSADDIKIDKLNVPEISAESYLVADLRNGSVFLEKNSAEIKPIASLTKLMTAVTASETIFIERTVLINKNILETYGDSGNLRLGEELSLDNLLYPLLMESSNDAAKAITEIIHGEKQFVSLMNYKAYSLGMRDTKFSDSSGINPENISTAEDLYFLAKYLLNKRSFLLKISKTSSKEIISRGGKTRHIFNNFNHFSGNKDFLGGKTGYTKDAGETMLSIFNIKIQDKIIPVAIIVLGSSDREEDTLKILEWIYGAAGRKKNESVQNNSDRKNEIKLAFVGDTMLNRGVFQKIISNGEWNFTYPFEKIYENIKNYDLFFGNLEGPISDKGKDIGNKYSFRMDPGAVKGLKFAGFDIMSVANNHIGDWGKEAMEDTFSRLKNSGILYVGGGVDSKEAYSPKIIEIQGVKIAFLGFSQFLEYLEAGENTSGIAIAYHNKILESVKKAKEKADVVVVSIHFGEEYREEPNSYQKEISRLAADSGADLIIGHHPHIIQPVEKYNSSYIVYSLGNFVFDQNFSNKTMEGALFEVSIKKDTKKIINTDLKKFKINSDFQPYFE